MQTKYRGFTIVKYESGDGSFVIYDALGHNMLKVKPWTLGEARECIDQYIEKRAGLRS